MKTKKKTSHAFFAAVVLMSLLVLSTIIGYFILLPRAIPKQILVAVLPFDGPATLSPHLTHEFPRHLTELIALSRDLTIVDFDASSDAIDLGEEFRGFTHELGATHIVDGNFVESIEKPGDFVLTIRVVDVMRPAWKLKWDEEYSYPSQTLLNIRNEAIEQILKSLYDNSVGDVADELDMEANFDDFLIAQLRSRSGDQSGVSSVLQQLPDIESNPYALHLLSLLNPQRKGYYLDLAVKSNPRHYPSLNAKAWLDYKKSGDLELYARTTTDLAATFPNSDAVVILADLYHALGWFAEEELLLLRWVKMRPRSGFAALKIGLSRFRAGNIPGVEEALSIAQFRDPLNDRVKLYKALYDLELNNVAVDSADSPELNVRILAARGRFDEAREILELMLGQLSCDQVVESAIYIGDLDLAFENLSCSEQFWTQPPGWWQAGESRWQSFIADPRYSDWLRSKGMVPSVIEKLSPASVPQLFAPVRRLLPQKTDSEVENS